MKSFFSGIAGVLILAGVFSVSARADDWGNMVRLFVDQTNVDYYYNPKTDLEKTINQSDAAIKSAKTISDSLNGQINSERAQIADLRREITDIEQHDTLKELDKTASKSFAASEKDFRENIGIWGHIKSFFGFKPESVKKAEADAKALVDTTKSYEENKSRLTAVDARANEKMKEIDAQTKAANAAQAIVTAKSAEMTALESKWMKQLPSMTLEQLKAHMATDTVLKDLTQKMNTAFDQQKEVGYDAKLLLSDLNGVKARFNMTDTQLAALRLGIGQRLSNTLVGQFVNEQVKSAMVQQCSDPKLAEACMKRNVQGITEGLNRVLYPISPSTSAQATDSKGKATGSGATGTGNRSSKASGDPHPMGHHDGDPIPWND